MNTDYRRSHLKKGPDYDDDLSQGDFDTYMTARECELIERIVHRGFPGGVPRYLDFACGTGRITQVVEPVAVESYGIDVSEAMLDTARAKCLRTTFIRADLTTRPIPLPPFDLVTAFRFFGNAQDELRAAALDAIRGVLAPGGLLILNDHVNPRSLHRRLLRLRGHAPDRGLAPRDLSRLLAAHGFDVVRAYGIGLWMLRARWNVPSVMRSRIVHTIEPLSRIPPLVSLCPDIVIVARRRPAL
jgi:SAM-dependent methyltransferase